VKATWYVLLEDEAGVKWSTCVDAVGYSQAVTFACDKMNHVGITDAYKPGAWQPVEIRRATILDKVAAA
jgi:hypothetical protein